MSKKSSKQTETENVINKPNNYWENDCEYTGFFLRFHCYQQRPSDFGKLKSNTTIVVVSIQLKLSVLKQLTIIIFHENIEHCETTENSNSNKRSSAPFDWYLRLLPNVGNVRAWLARVITHAVCNLSSSSYSELNHFDNFDNWIGWNLCEIEIQFEDFVERAVFVCVSSASCVRFLKKKHKARDREERARERTQRVCERARARENESVRVNEESVHTAEYYLYICICMCANRDIRVSYCWCVCFLYSLPLSSSSSWWWWWLF